MNKIDCVTAKMFTIFLQNVEAYSAYDRS